jgi:carbon-monoxide dehydrogenase small subunit
MQVSMSINGQAYSHDVEPRLLLVHYIREYAELHGTHWGCDTSNCGICVVLMDGEPIKSCTTLAAMAEGHEITTVEGLAAADGTLDPIQQGFHEMHALQCGFCTPGMMVTGRWLINKHPNPTQMTDHEIRDAISGGLCRCTGYTNIIKAIRWAAAYEANAAGRR